MDITELPFNRFIGIKKSERQGYLLELDDSPHYLNHVGTVHATAQLALAEAATGEFLIRQFQHIEGEYVPLLRRLDSKFRKPGQGRMFAKAKVSDDDAAKFLEELSLRGRALLSIEVDVEDAHGVVTLNAVAEWYVQKMLKQ